MSKMTGLQLKKLIADLDKRHKNFNEMEVVFYGHEDYMSALSNLEVKQLKKESVTADSQYEELYREPYDNEKPDKQFIVFLY